jgi:hypothetical protein
VEGVYWEEWSADCQTVSTDYREMDCFLVAGRSQRNATRVPADPIVRDERRARDMFSGNDLT